MKLLPSYSLSILKLIAIFSLLSPYVAQSDAKKMKIGFVLSTLQEERYQKDQKYFAEAAKKLGFEAVMLAADNNPQVQASKVENLLTQGVKALVIQPVNSAAAANLVKLAHDEKVPVIAYDRLITDSEIDAYVTFDSFKVGVIQAEEAVKATGGKGNFVILSGQAGHSVANEITAGNMSVLKKYSDIKVVLQKNHDSWSPSLAMTTVENALTQNKNKIDAILANNSGMAKGAVQALGEQGLAGKVFVAGADADLAAVKNIAQGKQALDVLKDIQPLAQTAAEVAFEIAQNGSKKNLSKWNPQVIKNGKFDVPVLNTPVYAITKENLEERIFKTGFHDRKAVYSDVK